MAAKTMVGLEITEEEIRAAEVTTGKNPKILAHGSLPLPAGVAKDSEVLESAKVISALEELWKKEKFSTKQVILGVVSRRVLVRDYRTAAVAPELLRQALPFQVADLLPMPVDQAVIDFYPVEQEETEVSGLLVAAVVETIKNLVVTVEDAKLEVAQVDLAPFGLMRAINVLSKPDESVAVIHLGPHTSYVMVAVRGVPRFIRIVSYEISGVAAVPMQNQLDPAMFPGDAPQQQNLQYQMEYQSESMTQEKIDDLVTQVVNTLRFYVDRSGSQSIDRVLLTGVGAGIPNMHAGFQQRIGLPVNITSGQQLQQGKGKSRASRQNNSYSATDLELLTTAGLAMSGERR